MSEIVLPRTQQAQHLVFAVRQRLVRRGFPVDAAANEQIRGITADIAPSARALVRSR